MKGFSPAFAALVVAALASAPALHATDPVYTHELKPAWLNAHDADLSTVGARFAFGARQDFDIPTFSAAWFTDTKGLVTAESRANPETISAEVGAEAFQRFGGTVVLTPSVAGSATFDPNATPPPIAPGTKGTHDILVGAGLKVGLETDQRFRNAEVTVGPRLSFTHTENSGLWPLLPSFTVAYQRVRAIRARYLEDNGISERSFWRLDVAAAWKWRPFERDGVAENPALAPIGLHVDARYFQAYSLPSKAKALSQEEAFYTAGTVSYDTERFHWRYVHDIFVTVAHGRIPPATRQDTTVFVGVTFMR